VIYNRVLCENLEFLGQSVAGRPYFLAASSALESILTWSFPVAFYPFITQRSYA
jgi:hypothetical protein